MAEGKGIACDIREDVFPGNRIRRTFMPHRYLVRSRHGRLETLAVFGLALCTAAVVSGCGTVRPEPDYRHTAELIVERTNVDDVYDPAMDAAVQEKVADLLEDGLTAEEAVHIALLNNRGFQSKFLEIGASRADVVQSALLSNPSLSLGVRFPQGGGRSGIGAGLAQELVDLWQIPVRKKIAKEQLEQVILNVVQSAIDLRAQVKTRYYELLAVQQGHAVTTENLNLVEQSLELAKDRFGAGESGLLDVNFAKANVLEVKMLLVAIRRDEATTRAALAQALGLSTGEKVWTLAGSLPEPSQEIGDDAFLFSLAVDERLDVQVAASELEAAHQEIRRQYRAIFPSVSAGLDIERTERRAPKSQPFNPLGSLPVAGSTPFSTPGQMAQMSPMERRQSFSDQTQPGREFVRDFAADRFDAKRARDFEKRQNIDVLMGPSLQITLPIWDQNRAQIAKARFKALQKQKDCEELLESVAQDVQQTASVLRGAAELACFFSEQSLPLASMNVETARRTYEAGEESILALMEAQKSLILQRKTYVDVLRDYGVALAELERALGGRLPPAGAGEASAGPALKAIADE